MSDQVELDINGRRAVVTKNDTHPKQYLWIDVDWKRYFLGVLKKGMTRRDVRAMAERWLRERPQYWRSCPVCCL